MIQETNKSPFIRHGYRSITLLTARYIQISNDGLAARWQDSTYIGSLDKYIEKQGRWQEIKYTKDGRPYIMYACRHRKHREYLDNFLKCR